MTNIEYNENKTRATFNGRLYYLRESQGYYYAPRKDRKGCDMLHRMVYIHYNGEISKGYHIHHKDGNKSNNDISNLECIKGTEHIRHHSLTLTEEQLEEKKRNLQENVRPKADIWHGSEAGREWHKFHYETVKEKMHQRMNNICVVCGKEYETSKRKDAKYCSKNCAAKGRRISGIDDEIRICEFCGKEFSANKYSEVKYCSSECRKLGRKKVMSEV